MRGLILIESPTKIQKIILTAKSAKGAKKDQEKTGAGFSSPAFAPFATLRLNRIPFNREAAKGAKIRKEEQEHFLLRGPLRPLRLCGRIIFLFAIQPKQSPMQNSLYTGYSQTPVDPAVMAMDNQRRLEKIGD